MSGSEQATSREIGDAQGVITAFWNDRSGGYDQQPGHGIMEERERDAWIRALREHLPATPSDVLDVGTGTGMLAFLFAKMGHRAVGVDLAEDMLAQGRRKASLTASAPRFLTGDAVEPPFEAQTFDVIANRHVLWTLREPERALANWRRLLRPGGRIIVIDGLYFAVAPKGNPEAQREPYPAQVSATLPLMSPDLTLDDVRSLIESAGFTHVRQSRLEEVERIECEIGYTGSVDAPRYVMTAVAP